MDTGIYRLKESNDFLGIEITRGTHHCILMGVIFIAIFYHDYFVILFFCGTLNLTIKGDDILKLLYNSPQKSKKLMILESLSQRSLLTQKYKNTLQNQKKGYEGERQYHHMLQKKLTSDCIVLYDLLLESNESEFQLDCIIIQEHQVWHLEVKNFEGVFQVRDQSIFNLRNNHEMKSPLNQLERAKFLLNHSLQKGDCKIPVRSYVIFVNPEFTLYQHDPSLPIVHPTDIQRFIEVLNNKPSRLSPYHHKLAHHLFTNQISDEPYQRLPEYKIDLLKRGVRCMGCSGFLSIKGTRLGCGECGYTEGLDTGIMRSVIEYHYLFPENRITTKTIWEWCNIKKSKDTFKRILSKYMVTDGVKRHRHFKFPKLN